MSSPALSLDAAALAVRRKAWGCIPTEDDGDPAALEWVKTFCDERNRFRRWHLVQIARNRKFYEGVHDLSVRSLLEPTAAGNYVFRRVKYKGGRALVVDNCIPEGVDNHVARLLRKQYEPTVRPTRLTPALQAAADLARDALLYDLERNQAWDGVRHRVTFDTVLDGQGVIRGWLDEAATDIVCQPHPDAASCQGCKAMFASRTLHARDLQGALGGLRRPDGAVVPMTGADRLTPIDGGPDVGMLHQMACCPLCGGELQDDTPLGDDLESGADVFGREYGRDMPRCEPRLQAVDIFEMFFENGGLGVEPHTNRIWGRRSIEDLDWLASRYPDAIPYMEKASLDDMMKVCPSLGDPTGNRGLVGLDNFSHHGLLTEVIAQPMELPGLELGRHIVVIGDHVARNQPLMVPVTFECDGRKETELVPRVSYAMPRFKRIRGRMYGWTPVHDAVPLNYALDKRWTMAEELTDRGKPFVALPEGAELIYDEEARGAFNEVRYRSVAPGFDPHRAIVNGSPITGNEYLPQIQALRQRIREVLGPGAAESGENPTGTKTIGQLQINVEQANIARGPAEDSLVDAFERCWRDHLGRKWALQEGSQELEVDDEGGESFRQESYEGTDLVGQTQVHVSAQAAQDDSVWQALAVENAIGKGWIDIQNDGAARDKAFDVMRIPKLNEQQSVQIQRAKQASAEFLRSMQPGEDGEPREPVIPVVDESLHDPWIRFQVLGAWWESDDGFQLQQKTGWLAVLPHIAGWERRLDAADKLAMQQQAVYGNRPPDQWPVIYQQGSQQVASMWAQYQQGVQLAAQAQQPPPPEPPMASFPEPPQPGESPAEQDRITRVLVEMVPAIGATPDTVPVEGHDVHQEIAGPAFAMLRMYATIQTYRRLDMKKKAAAMGGMPQPSAPGGASTPDGGTPRPGAPVRPAMGAADLRGAAA